jgi:hypothetical protein
MHRCVKELASNGRVLKQNERTNEIDA